MDDLASIYAEMGDEDLVHIAYADSGDYEAEAVEIAQQELKKRGIGKREAAALRARVERQHKPIPLPRSLRMLLVVFPAMWYRYRLLNPEKWKRTRADAVKFTLLGIGIWVVVIGIVVVLARLGVGRD